MPKTIICRCEDITEYEIRRAIDEGYADLESLKRYLGVCTGSCQGKGCLREAARILVEAAGADPASIRPVVARPPIAPVALKYFAGEEEP